MNDFIYVPVLKGKTGELDALKRTKAEIKANVRPLLEIPPIPPKYLDGGEDPIPAKSIDDHITDLSTKLTSVFDGFPAILIDGYYVEDEESLQDGREPVEGIFSVLRDNHVRFIPVIGLDRVFEYTVAIKKAITTGTQGCCLRVWERDLEAGARLEVYIGSLLKELAIPSSSVDILIDFVPNVPSKAAIPYQINAFPHLRDWRSVALASSSFPIDMSQVKQDSIETFERREWSAWTFLRANASSLVRMPIYGDYAINHPELSDVDPRLMRMSPNIRYTSTLDYVVAKGAAYPRKGDRVKKSGKKAADQYPKLATMIMSHDSWRGKDFSWGDEFIEACSRRACVGNATNWRSVGTCHHIASVVHQLSSLREP